MNTDVTYDYLIIGAGPAGLQLGYYLEQSKHNYLILEAGNTPGTFFKSFPRHRKLISNNKVYTGYAEGEINLRWDWNSLLSDSNKLLFKHYSKRYFPVADDMVRYLYDFAVQFNLNIKYEVKVAKVTKNGLFSVLDAMGTLYSCKRLIIATGLHTPYIPSIPGIELAEKYTEITIDPQQFTNQRVLIIGKGNSAFETAENLIETTSLIHILSPGPVQMAWKTKYVGHLRAVNNNILDTYQLKSQNVLLDASIEKIARDGERFVVSVAYTHAEGEREDLVYDRIILCTGWRFDDSIFDESARPQMVLDNRFPEQTSEWESTNIPDMYFAGTLMQVRDYKKKQSGFIHGFRYNVMALGHILEQKYHHREWPSKVIPCTAEALTREVIRRVNTSSALWQQTDYIADLIVVSDQAVHYYENIPVDYVHDSAFGKQDHYYIVTLNFGLDIILSRPDPFAIERIHKEDVDKSALSTGIHPIIRWFSCGHLIAEHHVIEDIASEWAEEVHTRPLQVFFQRELSRFANVLS